MKMSSATAKKQESPSGGEKAHANPINNKPAVSPAILSRANQLNPSYTVRIICCVLFIFLTEIFLAHYIYRLINSEIRSEYIAKNDLHRYVINECRDPDTRKEIATIFAELQSAANNVNNNNNHDNNNLNRTKRNTQRYRGNNYNVISSSNPHHQQHQSEEPFVEFFDPNIKTGDKKDEDIRRQIAKGTTPSGDSWVWLSGSSRIPEKTLTAYCKNVNDYCPPGRPGVPGSPGRPGVTGPKGERGDTGIPGIPGEMGVQGLTGLPGISGVKGEKGEKGDQGRQGLDGRDGIPGEPGLYGIPGRNGHDGKDGIPGRDGIDGLPGKDGINGQKGEVGPPGPQGPPGQRGLPGPRGRTGKSGSNGTPGIPGITAWKTMDKHNSTYLIAPSIAGSQFGSVDTVIIKEGENLRLHCSATGTPTPRISWQRLGGRPINRGPWMDIYASGNMLNFTSVHRDYMGTYMCIADNGVPPQANHTFKVEVHFGPLIRIANQIIEVPNGSKAILECDVEAFPDTIRYWERSDGLLLENGDKYRVNNDLNRNEYKVRMQLNITKILPSDTEDYFYYCISKNEELTTKGKFKIELYDPKYPPPHILSKGKNKETIFGALPPDKVALEDLCEPPPKCPECTDFKRPVKCTADGVSLIDLISRWEVRSFGEGKVYAGLGNRSTDCILYAVGKPVYHRSSEHNFGSWMRDPNAPSEKDYEKYWTTNEDEPTRLYEYDNKTFYRKDTPSRFYELDHPFGGNTHIVLNGNFYYNVKDTNRILKFNLHNKSTAALDLPVMASVNQTGRLYSTQYNYMDFNVDDNGLWVIFPVPFSNNTAVMKVDSDKMIPQYIWNISINHHKVGEMFIVCGVLYAVDSVGDRNTKIRFAFDLYKNTLLDVSLTYSNPFRKTTMIGYNHRNKELYSWDKGNQLTYPVRYHEIGYNYTAIKGDEKLDDENNAMSADSTGYDKF